MTFPIICDTHAAYMLECCYGLVIVVPHLMPGVVSIYSDATDGYGGTGAGTLTLFRKK
jgi:hypothetical protein